MGRKSNLTEVIRELFALSGNQCAFPGCTHRLINEDGTYIAQICHIEAANKKGQRYNPAQTDEQRRAAANLMLLCHEHHKVTDDEDKYPVSVLSEIKKNHENKFRLAVAVIDEKVLDKLTNELQAQLDGLLEVTIETNTIVQSVDQKVDIMMQQLTSLSNADNDKLYIAELDAIKELRKKGKVDTVIEMLLQYKDRNWPNLKPETKYKLIANLANSYLSLNKKREYAATIAELENIPFESADSVALQLLGFAVIDDHAGFDKFFEKALPRAGENINLWVAYIERYKGTKTAAQMLAEIPSSVAEKGNIIFHIGLKSIEEGNKNEGIELLRQAVSKFDPAEEKLSDSNTIIATYLMKDLVQPHQLVFKTHTEKEKKDLEEARRLFSESWEHIKNTELAASKWGTLMNRGVVNKVTGRTEEALSDFQKAFELSNEYLPYKNLLMTLMESGNLVAAEKLLQTTSFANEIPKEEIVINETFKARLFILQGKYKEAVSLLASHLTHDQGSSRDLELYSIICATCLQHNELEDARLYIEELIAAFPQEPDGHLFAGFMYLNTDKAKALEQYENAAQLMTTSSRPNHFNELATGYSDLGEFEKAIPCFEKIVDRSVYNQFTKGLIYAFYQAGDLDKALQLSESLFTTYDTVPFLAEIIGNIYDETNRYDDAMKITKAFQERASGNERDYFSLRAARIYSHKKDWDNVRVMATQVQDTSRIPLNDIFILAFLLVKCGEKQKGMQVAYEARTKFFDASEAHLKYISLSTDNRDKHEDLFPEQVEIDCAVTVRSENGDEETYVITDKNSRGGNVLKPLDDFANKLIGKKIGEDVILKKGYGIDYKVTIIGIMTMYVHAFRESLKLFETRFAGMHGVGVFRANPGQPDDQIEQVIKESTLSGNDFQKQVYGIYNKRIATIGVLAGLFKRNIVKQWMSLVTFPDIHIYSYAHDELVLVEQCVPAKKPLVIDLTSLLTNFFFLPENILFSATGTRLCVTQSTIEELQEFHDELEVHIEDGMLSMGFENGRMVGHSMTGEEIVKQRRKIADIIQWCRDNTEIMVPADLIKIKRKDRQKTAELFGDCFYDTALLAKELDAIILSDDDTYKNFIKTEYQVDAFSVLALALFEAKNGRLSDELYEQLTLNCILGNYIFIPINAAILWKVFDVAGFQVRKPFTTAVKGLHIMVPPMLAAIVSNFFKTLYLEAGLTVTREQTVIAVMGEMSRRPDFPQLKKYLVTFLQRDLRLMQPALQNILQLLRNF